MEINNLKPEDWIIHIWKKNKELGVVISVHTKTDTVNILLNPYKFDNISTVVSSKDIIRLTENKSVALKKAIDEIEATYEKLKVLKESINLIGVE